MFRSLLLRPLSLEFQRACCATKRDGLHRFSCCAISALYPERCLPRRKFSATAPCSAGHSHWKNVKHIKESRDIARANVMTRVAVRLRMAARQHGSTDPKQNPAIAKILEYARSEDLPADRLKDILIKLSSKKSELFTMEAKGPSGSMMIVEFLSDSPGRTKADIRYLIKKFPVQVADGSQSVGIKFNFEFKGVITAKQANGSVDLDKAEEDAIEAGAEEVSEGPGDNEIVFICDPMDSAKVVKELEKKDYKVIDSTTEYLPKQNVELEEAAKGELDILLQKLEEHPDTAKVYRNWV